MAKILPASTSTMASATMLCKLIHSIHEIAKDGNKARAIVLLDD
jgi:hypothetical protein